MTNEAYYIVALIALFIVPKILLRLRIPAAITALGLGLLAGLGLGLFQGDPTIEMLALFGIVSLFLFAGLDIDFAELQTQAGVLIWHLLIGTALLVIVAAVIQAIFGLPTRPAVLVSLALTTPSTGFILSSLPGSNLSPQEQFWVRSKAIGTELVALAALFLIMQSDSLLIFGRSLFMLTALIVVLPLAFYAFARIVLPYAPDSEFAFLLMVAVVSAFLTRYLGVYYLVGAFVVGLVARRFEELPAMKSDRILSALDLFGSVFVPFYFFGAGLHIRAEDFSLDALTVGAGFLLIMIPVRVLVVAFHRQLALNEGFWQATRVGVAIIPTLVFTLVIAGILREKFSVSPVIFGGLIIYTLGNTLLPGLTIGTGKARQWFRGRRPRKPEGKRRFTIFGGSKSTAD